MDSASYNVEQFANWLSTLGATHLLLVVALLTLIVVWRFSLRFRQLVELLEAQLEETRALRRDVNGLRSDTRVLEEELRVDLMHRGPR
jgi:hypothetical protein